MNIPELKTHLAEWAIELDPRPIPQFMPDGTEVKTAEQVAALLNIPVTEAALRLEQKDVYSASATHALGMGVGTRVQGLTVENRAKRPGLRKRRKKRQNKEKDA